MTRQPPRWMTVGANALLLCSTALLIAVAVQRFRPRSQLPAIRQIRSGPELVAVFLVASTCGASHNPTLPPLLDSIRVRLGERAAAEGEQLVIIGVSLDDDPTTGTRFLSHFGRFDAVIAGGGWAGPGALSYMIRDLHGDLAMPQLVLLSRVVTIGQTSIASSSDHVLGRFVGPSQLAILAKAPPVVSGDTSGRVGQR